MEVSELIQIISTVGFPIFACCVMFYQNNSLQKTLGDIQVTMQKMADNIADLDGKERDHGTGN